jgi:hypothetical protein
VDLHPKEPFAPLPRLLHFGIELLRRILRRRRRADDRRIDRRAVLEEQPLCLEQALHHGEHLRGELVLLEQVPEVENRGLVRHPSSLSSTRAKRRMASLS